MLGFDVPTFVFQLINFVILLAILSKFFYRPVLDLMQRRQEQIDARIADAESRARQADEEREKLSRLSQTAAAEASALVDAARNEAAKERQRLLEAARQEAALLIDEARRTAAAEEQTMLGRVSSRLSNSAVTIAGTLIRDASGEAVHQGLVERLLSDGFGLDESAQAQAKLDFGNDVCSLVVESAYPVDAAQQQRLRLQAAQTLARPIDEVQLEVRQEPSLIAGMRVMVGALVIDMSLKHLLEDLSGREGDY